MVKSKWLKGSIVLMVSIFSLMVFLAGCSSNNNSSSNSSTPSNQSNTNTTGNEAPKEGEMAAELPFVKLTWLLRSGDEQDLPLIQAEMNKIIKEEINAEVELKFIDPGSFNERLRTTIAAAEDFDITFTSHWAGDFYGYVARGAFLPITDLVQQYAPKTFASMPDEFWGAVTIGGDVYGVPNYQIVARQNGVGVQKEMLNKYNFNLNNVNKLEDIEPLLKQLKEGEPQNKVIFLMSKSGLWGETLVYYGIEDIGSRHTPGASYIDDPFKVINQFESNEFKQHIELMRSWYLSGYIQRDAATFNDPLSLMKSGNVLAIWNNTKPGDTEEIKVLFGGNEMEIKVLDVPFVTTNNIAATLQAINRNSKNPERAMMLLELINNHKELFNIMVFGIEDKHYKKIGENRIEPIKDSGYFPNRAWSFGNQFNAFLVPGQDDDVWEQTILLNQSAKASQLLGFVFNPEPVNSEIAQSQSVIDEFGPALWTGSVDPDEYLQEFLDKLASAGADRIIAEKQAQIDAWLANN